MLRVPRQHLLHACVPSNPPACLPARSPSCSPPPPFSWPPPQRFDQLSLSLSFPLSRSSRFQWSLERGGQLAATWGIHRFNLLPHHTTPSLPIARHCDNGFRVLRAILYFGIWEGTVALDIALPEGGRATLVIHVLSASHNSWPGNTYFPVLSGANLHLNPTSSSSVPFSCNR